MQDVIWTIFLTWLAWKLWSFFSNSRRFYIQKNVYHNYNNNQDGKTTILKTNSNKSKIKSKNEGEYVDYEEIKK